MYLFVRYLSYFLYTYLFTIYLSQSFHSLSIYLSLCLCLFIYLNLFIVYLSISIHSYSFSLFRAIYQHFHNLSVYLSISIFPQLSVCLFIYLSKSFHSLFIYLLIYINLVIVYIKIKKLMYHVHYTQPYSSAGSTIEIL